MGCGSLVYHQGLDIQEKDIQRSGWKSVRGLEGTEADREGRERDMSGLIDRQAAITTSLEFIVEYLGGAFDEDFQKELKKRLEALPSAEPEIAENLYLCKCYITDKDGLQHEVIHTGDIRRVTGWEI